LKAVIFDLDGTLLNTLDDLADCMNRVLINHGFPPYPTENYKYYVGKGMQNLVNQAANPFARDKIILDQMLEEMKEEYKNNWDKKTKPYPGIPDMLAELCESGFLLSVLSNKPDPFAKITVTHFFPQIPFFEVQGAQDIVPKKPNPIGILSIIEKTNLPKKEWIMIGDSSVDMETAKNASIFPAGVLWGFREKDELIQSGAKLVFGHPKEIVTFLNQSN